MTSFLKDNKKELITAYFENRLEEHVTSLKSKGATKRKRKPTEKMQSLQKNEASPEKTSQKKITEETTNMKTIEYFKKKKAKVILITL